MNYEQIKMMGDKVLIRISAKSIEDIYSKEIIRNDGTKTRLFITVPADEKDERQSQLTVSTGTVEAVGEGMYDDETGEKLQMPDIRRGDTAIISYELFNDARKFISMDGEDKIIWANAITTYHHSDRVVYADRQEYHGRRVNKKDQIVWRKGEVNNLSQIIGIIRGEKLLTNDPYIFLNHLSNKYEVITKSGIIHTKTLDVIERVVLSVPGGGTWYGISEGDVVGIREADVFDVVLQDRKITAVNDTDILYVEKYKSKLHVV